MNQRKVEKCQIRGLLFRRYHYNCPHCGESLVSPYADAEKVTECPECEEEFLSPAKRDSLRWRMRRRIEFHTRSLRPVNLLSIKTQLVEILLFLSGGLMYWLAFVQLLTSLAALTEEQTLPPNSVQTNFVIWHGSALLHFFFIWIDERQCASPDYRKFAFRYFVLMLTLLGPTAAVVKQSLWFLPISLLGLMVMFGGIYRVIEADYWDAQAKKARDEEDRLRKRAEEEAQWRWRSKRP